MKSKTITISKPKLFKAFRRLTNAFERLSDDEVIKLIDESYSIEIRLNLKGNKEESSLPLEIDIPTIVAKITSLSSREEAQSFLDKNCATRKVLEPIARSLDIPIARQDKIETLRDKIIESTIGARIRSQAIQGNQT